MYKVYGGVISRAFRVMWMLEELKVPWEHVDAKPRSPEVVALNGSGKLPVMVHDGHTLTDSTAILTYLADRHEQLTFPPGTLERARQDALTFMLLDEFDSVLWTAAKHSFVLPEERRVPAVKDTLKWEFAASAKRLAERMDGPFLQGDNMTIADIVATHCLNWAIGAKFPMEEERLADYARAMRARPAFRSVQERAAA